jgi:hypothetical protein
VLGIRDAASRIRRWCWKATYGWNWAADVPQDAGAQVHPAHPLRVAAGDHLQAVARKGFAYRRIKERRR